MAARPGTGLIRRVTCNDMQFDVQSASVPANAGSWASMNVQWLRNSLNLGSRVAVTVQAAARVRSLSLRRLLETHEQDLLDAWDAYS